MGWQGATVVVEVDVVLVVGAIVVVELVVLVEVDVDVAGEIVVVDVVEIHPAPTSDARKIVLS
jgi:hypothetical protein